MLRVINKLYNCKWLYLKFVEFSFTAGFFGWISGQTKKNIGRFSIQFKILYFHETVFLPKMTTKLSLVEKKMDICYANGVEYSPSARSINEK